MLPWSGANTNRARLRAAASLHESLIAKKREFPLARHFVIGHSHGGNVALYALNLTTSADLVSGVICLATPFLWFREIGEYDLRHWPSVFCMIAVLLLCGCILGQGLAALHVTGLFTWSCILVRQKKSWVDSGSGNLPSE